MDSALFSSFMFFGIVSSKKGNVSYISGILFSLLALVFLSDLRPAQTCSHSPKSCIQSRFGPGLPQIPHSPSRSILLLLAAVNTFLLNSMSTVHILLSAPPQQKYRVRPGRAPCDDNVSDRKETAVNMRVSKQKFTPHYRGFISTHSFIHSLNFQYIAFTLIVNNCFSLHFNQS